MKAEQKVVITVSPAVIEHDRAEIRKFSSSVEFFSTREKKFHISKQPCNLLFII